jgi:hypothetical protein
MLAVDKARAAGITSQSALEIVLMPPGTIACCAMCLSCSLVGHLVSDRVQEEPVAEGSSAEAALFGITLSEGISYGRGLWLVLLGAH